MPRTFKEFLPEKDYAGRLALGLGLLILGQAMTLYDGVLYTVLRWIFFTSALVNYGMILFLYQRQKQDKIRAREEAESKLPETTKPKE
jgi:hypothetical protein